MDLKILTLAEYAALSQSNQLIIAGTVDQVEFVRAPNVPNDRVGPIPMPNVFLVASTEASLTDGMRHSLGLRVLDDDGKLVADLPAIGEVTFMANPHGRPMRHNQIVAMRGLAVPRAGDYTIEYMVGGRCLGRVGFAVIEVTRPTGGP